MPKVAKLRKTGTMQNAASEGADYLKRSWGKTKFEKVQELLKAREVELAPTSSTKVEEAKTKASPKKPRLAKNNTMVNTAQESKSILKNTKIDSDAKTRNQAKTIKKLTSKPKLSKNQTMVNTAQESKSILKNTKIDSDAKTRNQAKAINKLTSKAKPKLAKNKTMVNTAQESKSILKNTKIDSDAKTRNQAKTINKLTSKAKPKLTKSQTMLETAKESKEILKNVNIDEDAKTRRQSNQIKQLTTPKPALKKRGTMTATTQEALNLLTREPLKSRRGAGAAKSLKKKSAKPKATAKRPSKLKRAGTMQKTIKDGKEFIKLKGKKTKL